MDDAAVRASLIRLLDAAQVATPAPAAARPARASRFLSKRLWNNLPPQSRERECPICLDTVRDFADFALLPCGHSFHTHCADATDRCAVCRQ